jgi:outer membrane protein OmpA-like peptidoglycan-associated protein
MFDSNQRHLAATCLLAALMAVCGSALVGCQTPPPAPLPAAYSGPVLPIEQSERGVQIFLPASVLFASGSAEFDAAQAGPYLDRVATLLKTKTAKDVAVEGHADNVGSNDANQRLSQARSANVLRALAERGVPAARLASQGFSFNRPIASNATDDGRRLNRRVELIVLGEKVEAITRGEPAAAFESAWARLKDLVDRGLVQRAAGAAP